MARSIGATPVAVIAGSALIAAAVYFGLRARPVVVAPASATAPVAVSDSPVPGGAAGAPASSGAPPVSTAVATLLTQMAGVAPSSAADVDRDALAALEKQRPALVDSCWKPLKASQPTVTSAAYDVDLAFNASGREVSKGLSGREGASTELTQCLYAHSPVLIIPSRGARTHAHVRFTLP